MSRNRMRAVGASDRERAISARKLGGRDGRVQAGARDRRVQAEGRDRRAQTEGRDRRAQTGGRDRRVQTGGRDRRVQTGARDRREKRWSEARPKVKTVLIGKAKTPKIEVLARLPLVGTEQEKNQIRKESRRPVASLRLPGSFFDENMLIP